MPFVEWDNSLSIGIEIIDNQHKQLIQMLNDLSNTSSSSDKQTASATCLRKMRNYSEIHFADEEQFMKEVNYPEIETQKEKHKEFIEKISDYEDAQIFSYTPFQDMLEFLKSWLVNHIKGSDTKIATFINQKE